MYKKIEDKTMHNNKHSDIILRAIINSVPQYVFWKDTHSVYLGCNRNYAQLLKLKSTDAIVDKTDYDLNWQSLGSSAKEFQEDDLKVLSGEPIFNKTEILHLPDGQQLVTLLNKTALTYGKEVIGVIGYFSDITEMRDLCVSNRLLKSRVIELQLGPREDVLFKQKVRYSNAG